METQNLANKYRPRTFEDVSEQQVVVNILKSICNDKDLKCRNFLLIGSAGVGKTTLGYIIASELNKSKDNIIFMDAASHSSVENVREIVEQARQYPLGTDWKVFILDEVHAFSDKAWQALLTTLEAGPAKSIFVLCTTNPEKIPGTILSRVQTFQLSKISLNGIVNRLKYVLDKEIEEGRQITYEVDALTFIAKLAQGGMRDALTLLDKALAYSLNVDMKNISESLNLPNYDDYFSLLNAYAKKNNEAIAKIIDDVYNSGVNFSKWFEGFHSFVINIVKYILLKDISATMIPSIYEEKVANYSNAHSVICLKLANRLMDLLKDLKGTRYLQETALTYLCQPTK